MKILGLSFDYHDSAAALILDGEIVAAVSEERFTRKKNDASFPQKSIDFCLQQGNLNPKDLDFVVFYEDSFLKFNRIVKKSIFDSEKRKKYLWPVINDWLIKGKFSTKDRIKDYLKISSDKIHSIKHHQSHAGSAYYCSDFQEASIITLDGVGEYQTMTISHGKGNSIQLLEECNLPNSIGLFYSAITAYLGFAVNEDEYKVMGMAGYGKDTYYKQIRDLFTLSDNGTFKIDQSYFEFLNPTELPFNQKFEELLGKRRNPSSEFFLKKDKKYDEEALLNNKRFADIAASAQKVTEEVIEHIIVSAIKKTNSKNVCLSGGVALNSLANGKIKKKYDLNMFVQPASGDAGSSIGAALYFYNSIQKADSKRVPMSHAYLGPSYTNEEVSIAIQKSLTKNYRFYDTDEDLFKSLIELFLSGKVVGWLNGRSEFGPRALGARSILANPIYPDMQNIVNRSIKFREAFRPFAPAVLEEEAERFFNLLICLVRCMKSE